MTSLESEVMGILECWMVGSGTWRASGRLCGHKECAGGRWRWFADRANHFKWTRDGGGIMEANERED